MLAVQNACSIQHLRNPFFWCLPPSFADDVFHGKTVEYLADTYVPFWIKPTRFINMVNSETRRPWLDFGDRAAYHLDSYPEQLMVAERETVMRDVLKAVHDVMTSKKYEPFRVYTPSNLADWPLRRGQGIPNCKKSDNSEAWVISWLEPEGHFNPHEISGVLDDSTLRGKTTVSLAGSPFNSMGGLVRTWAMHWLKDSRK
ncbi:hypothetical protein PIB30_092063 [Stylosanthes scabra]|uniref:Uncharacterized protein n=1 Tax=Stylosanthes scabra TaxID=79078 RepID=A0ABU6YW58_9FABA|nr:hypothetical protein [Stylosanthes scabra]